MLNKAKLFIFLSPCLFFFSLFACYMLIMFIMTNKTFYFDISFQMLSCIMALSDAFIATTF